MGRKKSRCRATESPVAIVNLNQAAEPIIRDHVGQSGSRATQRCTRGRKIGEQRMQRVEGMCGGWGGVGGGRVVCQEETGERCGKGQGVGGEH